MLVLTRKPGEKIRIGQNIWVTAVECRDGKVRLGVEAPRDIDICREEVERHFDLKMLVPEASPDENAA
jgi:carbon storage regulator